MATEEPLFQAEVVYSGGVENLLSVLRCVRDVAVSFSGKSYSGDLTGRRKEGVTSYLFTKVEDAARFKKRVLEMKTESHPGSEYVERVDLTKLGDEEPVPSELTESERVKLSELGLPAPRSLADYF